MDDRITLILDTVYDVKFERLEDYRESVFRDVYRNASAMVSEIVRNNEKLEEERFHDIAMEEQVCNVIAFLGGRGSGKSSVLMSYCSFLKRFREYYGNSNKTILPQLDKELRDLLNKGSESKINFSVLNVIDATMLENDETIIGIVLARMLDMVKDKESELGRDGRSYGDMTERGRNIKTEIGRIYRYMHCKPKLNIEEEVPVLMVEALSNSWNLRNSFKELVNQLNDFLVGNNDGYSSAPQAENYLVIPVDDIDMNVDKCREMLEMIRKYLMVPRVILLLNFNYEQLDIVCRNYYRKALFPLESEKENFTEFFSETVKNGRKEGTKESNRESYQEKNKKVQELAREYLEKVIPTGRKIYMPHLYRLDNGMQNKVFMGGFCPNGIKPEIYMKPEEYICALLRFYTGIVCLPDERNEYIYPQSIRRLNNYVKELLDLKSLEEVKGTELDSAEAHDERYKRNIDWLYRDVTNRFMEQYVEGKDKEVIREYLKNAEDEKECSLLNMLLKRAGDGHGQWHEMVRQIDYERRRRGYISYGDYLFMFFIIRKNRLMGDDALVCWHLLISVRYTQLYLRSGRKKDGLKKDLWGAIDNWYWYKDVRDGKSIPTIMDKPSNSNRIQQLIWIKDGFLDTNDDELGKAVRAYFLMRMFLTPMSHADHKKRSPNVLGIDLILGLDTSVRWSFQAGGFLYFVCHYKEMLEEYTSEIMQDVEQTDRAARTKIHRLKEEFIEKMDGWVEKYKTNQLIPLFSSQLMGRIQHRFYSTEKMEISDIRSRIEELLDIMEDELEHLEQWNAYEKDVPESRKGNTESKLSWNDLLEDGKKQEEYFTISSCREAFDTCPVVSLLREKGDVADHAFRALYIVLNEMSNSAVALENSQNAEDTIG